MTIGWDKYGRQQVGAKASYFLTPNLSGSAGVSVHLTHRAIDTDAITQNSRRTASRVAVSSPHLRPASRTGIRTTWAPSFTVS